MYIYDEILGIYINTSPLLVSSRVLQAAKDIDPRIQLQWDNHGFICGISHDLATKLTKKLGMRMLTVQEFMQLARRHPELQSEEFAEWLSDTYRLFEGNEIPTDLNGAVALKKDTFSSVLVSPNSSISIPIARPGWFRLDKISEKGLPTKLSSMNQPGLWKFWSTGHTFFIGGAMRSFVTSSGTCSLDLGIPVFAKHPKIMVRECYDKVEAPAGSPLDILWPTYEKLIHSRDQVGLRKFLADLDISEISDGDVQDEFLHHRNKERLVDMVGKKRLLEEDTKDLTIIDRRVLLDTLLSIPDDSTAFVMGHARPDADSIVSSIFEAVRRHLVYPDRGCLPWSESIPREVEHILDLEATNLMSKITPPGPRNSIILTDCHETDPKYQMGVRAIIDHHILDGKEFPYYVALSHEVSWSSTIQVYIKILGSGQDLSPDMAKILLEATRLEAEPSLIPYMSETDQLAIRRLESIAGHEMVGTYRELMGIMVESAESEELFYRDYRQTSYGFSVVKSRKGQDFRKMAEANNTKYYLPLTVVKDIVYEEDFSGVQSETILLVTNPVFHDKGFKYTLERTIAAACRQFHKRASILIEEASITLNNIDFQTPRLLLMPLIETLVKEHMRFRYACSVDRYIALGFFCGSNEEYGKPGEEELVKTGISFFDVKRLLRGKRQTSFLTLPEYWKVYHEMESRGDIPALKSLQHDRYVELLDTFISNSKTITHGSAPPQEIFIQVARPTLIRPSEGDEETGLPGKLHDPDNYGDRSLWRYWSPDSEQNVATRGHIFVMNQTSIDLKVRPEETTKQLTFRPVYEDVPDMTVEIENDDEANWVKLRVFPRIFSVYNK